MVHVKQSWMILDQSLKALFAFQEWQLLQVLAVQTQQIKHVVNQRSFCRPRFTSHSKRGKPWVGSQDGVKGSGTRAPLKSIVHPPPPDVPSVVVLVLLHFGKQQYQSGCLAAGFFR